MTPFDDRFAERVREVFDGYHEPVDPAELARLQAALRADATAPDGATSAGAAPTGAAPTRDPGPRPPARGLRPAEARWTRRRTLAAAAALLLALGGGLLAVQLGERSGPAEGAVAAASGAERAQLGAEDLSEPAPEPDASDQGDGAQEPPAPTVRQRAAGPAPAALADRSAGPSSRSGDGGRPGREQTARPEVPRPSEAAPPDRVAVQTSGGVDRDLAGADLAGRTSSGAAGADRPDARSSGPLVAMAPRPPEAGARRAPAADPVPTRPLAVGAPDAAGADGLRVTVATTSAFSGGRRAAGGGVSAGLARDWRLGRGVSLSGGAVASYNRLTIDPGGVTATQAFDAVERDPAAEVDVTTQSTLTTLAIEVPLDLGVDVVRTRRGRVGVAVGVTSALYLAQEFRDEGQRVSGELFSSPTSDEPRTAVSSESFASRETDGPLGRLDLARQLNLTLRLAGPGERPVALDVTARLPLAGVTSRDLPLTTVGLRLRVTL